MTTSRRLINTSVLIALVAMVLALVGVPPAEGRLRAHLPGNDHQPRRRATTNAVRGGGAFGINFHIRGRLSRLLGTTGVGRER